jgi:hypothetical protein
MAALQLDSQSVQPIDRLVMVVEAGRRPDFARQRRLPDRRFTVGAEPASRDSEADVRLAPDRPAVTAHRAAGPGEARARE